MLLSRDTEAMETKEELRLPSSYRLDESDPDVLLLCRHDGTLVAAFSACGATKAGIVEVATQDSRALLTRNKPPRS